MALNPKPAVSHALPYTQARLIQVLGDRWIFSAGHSMLILSDLANIPLDIFGVSAGRNLHILEFGFSTVLVRFLEPLVRPVQF